jgi:glycosyltransferase involved in cell wall biosynthesis
VDEKFYLPGKDRREDNTILYVGRLAYRKGLFDLLASSKTILKERPDAKFLIVGKGPLRGLLEKRVKDAGVETSFQFLGFLPLKDLQSIYRSAAVCVVPSHYEGQPTTLLEAMSSGAPIVGTNIPSISGVLTHDVDGILAQSKSPELLANAIIGLMNDGEKRAEIGQNARRTVEKAFTWDIVTDRIENSYGKINPELE